jgi:hypothetical protein
MGGSDSDDTDGEGMAVGIAVGAALGVALGFAMDIDS